MARVSVSEYLARLSVATRVLGTTCEIEFSGELDITGRGAAQSAINDVFGQRPERVVLDLSRLTFMDSTGVHLAADARDRAAATHVDLVLIPGPPAVQRVFEIAGTESRGFAFSWASPLQGVTRES